MKKSTSTDELRNRIRSWMDDNPKRAQAGERMLAQLERIQSEFSGDTGRRLESLVEETLDRQLKVDASRRAGLEAARRLGDSVRELAQSLQSCLKLVHTANQSLASAKVGESPDRIAYVAKARVDKKLLN